MRATVLLLRTEDNDPSEDLNLSWCTNYSARIALPPVLGISQVVT